jgi:hypothetical protein
MEIKAAITDFANRLHALIEKDSMERARTAILSAFGVHPPRKPGRPPKAATRVAPVAKKIRKKAPRQLCPVPGCKNPAAPIFGMVCSKHKDVAKSKIKKYREARKAKKLGGKAVVRKAPKRRAKKAGRPNAVAVVQSPTAVGA